MVCPPPLPLTTWLTSLSLQSLSPLSLPYLLPTLHPILMPHVGAIPMRTTIGTRAIPFQSPLTPPRSNGHSPWCYMHNCSPHLTSLIGCVHKPRRIVYPVSHNTPTCRNPVLMHLITPVYTTTISASHQVNEHFSSFSGHTPTPNAFTKAVHLRPIWTCPFPNAHAPFTATPSHPPPPRATPRMSPQPSQAAPCPSVLSASAGTSTLCLSFSVRQSEPGTINSTLSSNVSTKHFGSKTPASSYAACSSMKMDATKNMTTCMHAQVVEVSHTALAHALERRRWQPQTPYRANTWKLELKQTGLIDRFPSIPAGLHHGFIVGYPALSSVQTPPNSTSLAVYEPEFRDIVNKELAKGRYIGPFPFSRIEASLGPFQTSPLSLIPNPGKPGKFCLIQNFSFPIEVSPCFPNPSINQAVMEEFFPCTWGKCSIIYLLISHLPAGSQVATRNVVEAY